MFLEIFFFKAPCTIHVTEIAPSATAAFSSHISLRNSCQQITLRFITKDSMPEANTAIAAATAPWASLDQMPCEVLMELLSYLDVSEICNISRVCKAFVAVANSDEVWKRLVSALMLKPANHLHSAHLSLK
jgi:hypothetical protein